MKQNTFFCAGISLNQFLHSFIIRSECLTCTFRASFCSARLSRAQVLAIAGSSVQDRTTKRGGRGGGSVCTGGYKGVQAVRPESVAGGGCLTCTFRASCCCARLSRAPVPAFAGSSVRDREKNVCVWGGGVIKGGPPALAGTREYEQSDRNR